MGAIEWVSQVEAVHCGVAKRTLKLYGWVPSQLQAHTSLNQGCISNCGIRANPISFPQSVIAACFKRWFDWAHHRRVGNWTPDPFDVAQGRPSRASGSNDGEHSRTTIKTFENSHRVLVIPRGLLRGSSAKPIPGFQIRLLGECRGADFGAFTASFLHRQRSAVERDDDFFGADSCYLACRERMVFLV
ncbi:MAG: hypothetical protein HW419_383 [Deltaproteobacteria bacterium]|nr:hypothetical protein [Deltaproteobacteria bacterium]